MTCSAILDAFLPAVAAYGAKGAAWRARLGIGRPAEALAGGIGAARVDLWSGGLFDFSGGGGPATALIVAAWSRPWRRGDFIGVERPEAWPDPVDLVAWRPDAGRTWRWRGAARWLGTDPGSLEPGEPFRLCGSVLSWLEALDADPDAAAGVLLDPVPATNAAVQRDPSAVPLRDLLDGVAEVVCDDEEHAARVARLLAVGGPKLPGLCYARREAAA